MINLVLCGGSGTRLWPLSRSKLPKQFIPLFDNHSIFEETIIRNRPFCSNFAIAASAEHSILAAKQLSSLGLAFEEGFIEPIGRNTAPAITLAVLGMDRDELVFVTPSDHRITKLPEYESAVRRAIELARSGSLVTFGITPYRAETGYGYIESREEDVLTFKEKPDKQTAEEFLATGRYLWNSGMFLFQAGTFLEELERYAPDVLVTCKKARESAGNTRLISPSRGAMEAIPGISVDYAVMEKSSRVKVVSCNPGWSDIGSFDELFEETIGNEQNAVVAKNVILSDSSKCLVIGNNRTIVLEGVDDLIVVDTQDALLVIKRGESQKVKDIVKKISEERPELL